nr:MAG TPA: hypothetical protein [Caudoviricetes sp.]
MYFTTHHEKQPYYSFTYIGYTLLQYTYRLITHCVVYYGCDNSSTLLSDFILHVTL